MRLAKGGLRLTHREVGAVGRLRRIGSVHSAAQDASDATVCRPVGLPVGLSAQPLSVRCARRTPLRVQHVRI